MLEFHVPGEATGMAAENTSSTWTTADHMEDPNGASWLWPQQAPAMMDIRELGWGPSSSNSNLTSWSCLSWDTAGDRYLKYFGSYHPNRSTNLSPGHWPGPCKYSRSKETTICPRSSPFLCLCLSNQFLVRKPKWRLLNLKKKKKKFSL